METLIVSNCPKLWKQWISALKVLHGRCNLTICQRILRWTKNWMHTWITLHETIWDKINSIQWLWIKICAGKGAVNHTESVNYYGDYVEVLKCHHSDRGIVFTVSVSVFGKKYLWAKQYSDIQPIIKHHVALDNILTTKLPY